MTELKELNGMEDSRDSSTVEVDHVKNSLDETDDLCDSLISLFEYVDNVTGCAHDQMKGVVTTDDISETVDMEDEDCSTPVDVNYFEDVVLPTNADGQVNKSLETADKGRDASMYVIADKTEDVPKEQDEADIPVSNVCCNEHNIVTSTSDHVKVIPLSNGTSIGYIDDKLGIATQKADSDSLCLACVHVPKNKHEAINTPDYIYIPAQAVNEDFDTKNLEEGNSHSQSVEECKSSKIDHTWTKADYLPAQTVDEVMDKEASDKEYTDFQSESSQGDQTVIHIQTKNSKFTEQKKTEEGQSGTTVNGEECAASNILTLGSHDSFKTNTYKDDLYDSKFDHSHSNCTNDPIKVKKRHLSSSAECPVTPKRLKSIEEAFQGTNTLSPIENVMSLKERRPLDAFEETPKVCESQDLDKGRIRPVSSTPLVQNFGKTKMLSSRKVKFNIDLADIKDETESRISFDNKNLSTVRSVSKEDESTLLSENLKDVHNDVRNVFKTGDELQSEPDGILEEQDTEQDKISIIKMENEADLTESRLTGQNNDSSCLNLPVDNVDTLGEYKSTSLPITDSSYFAQSTNRPEGRFKNVEASISKIDLEEDIILSEDVLGLENDYNDSDIDEETLLAEDFDVVCKDGKAFKEEKPACEINVEVEKAEKSICDEYAEQVPIVKATTGELKSDLSKQVVRSNIYSIDIEISSVTQNVSEHVNKSNEQVVKVQVDIDNRNEKENKPLGTQLKNSAERKDDIGIEKVKTQVKSEVLQDTKSTVCSNKTEGGTVVQDTPNKNVNNCKNTANTYPVQSMDSSLLVGDKNNSLMKEVKRKWKTDSIPSQDINLTAAVTYHQKYSNMKNFCPALLEGEKINCLNFYDETSTKHPKINHYSLKEVLMKLRNQKKDLEKMKLTAIHAFEQNCFRRSRHLKTRHRDEFEQLHRRQCNQYNYVRYRYDILPFVKQQHLIQLRIDHQKEKDRLAHHQRLELESLVREVKSSLFEEIEQHKEQVSPVEKLISQVESMSKSKISNSGRYGSPVMVSFQKRPCKENNWKTSTVEEFLPLMMAQALSHEDKIYNHFYKF